MEVVNQIVMKKLNEIKPYFRNPRSNDETVKMLVKIIPQVGFNVPILIDKNGVIVKGHARYKAAFKLGMEEIPCVVTNATEEQIKLDRITDNKISELSEWLNEGLKHEIDMLDFSFDEILNDLDLKTAIEVSDDLNVVDDIDDDSKIITDEQKQKIYQEMLEKEKEKAMKELEEGIKKAEINQYENSLQKTKKYVKCCCSKCGEEFYIDYDKIVVIEMKK